MVFPTDSKLPRSDIATAQKHLFLCLGPDCCNSAEHQSLWNLLKEESRKIPILRTKAACLRICKGGPWLVIYPEGVWYGQLTAERLRRILEEHVKQGRPVREWIAAEMPGLRRDG